MTPANRRQFIGGGLIASVSAAATAVATAGHADADSHPQTGQAANQTKTPPFHGTHQEAILSQPLACSTHVAFDVKAADKAELKQLLQTITQRARSLTAGERSDATGDVSGPEPDSGTMGPDQPASGLEVIVSAGASLFDKRFGLSRQKPKQLRQMDTFVNDRLERNQCDGDLLLTLAAPDRDTVLHALRDIMRATRSLMQVRWRVDGFTPPSRPTGAPRNQFGFKDGIANPNPTSDKQMGELVWANGHVEPAWTTGGSYHVLRIIRMRLEFWDRVSVTEQERMFGRRKDSGAPLSGSKETDAPDYSNDPKGTVIPLDSHIRMANPRTKETAISQFLRRSYSYDRGMDDVGDLDVGLVFMAFQQDLDRQFVAVQKRLADEPLVDYITPVGGGYFFAFPGVRDAQDFYGSTLLA